MSKQSIYSKCFCFLLLMILSAGCSNQLEKSVSYPNYNDNYKLSPEETVLLDSIQHKTYLFFMNERNPEYGLVKDRSASWAPASIAAIGFALPSYAVGVERGWITRNEAAEITLTILRFFFNLDMNLWSSARVAQRSLVHLRAAGGGAMVLVSSIWGRESGGAPGYNVAKAGVVALAKALAREVAAEGIRVNSVAPGSILFPGGSWWKRQQADPEGLAEFVRRELPFGRFRTPEEVAHAVVFLASPKASWISGASIVVDGCQSRSLI